MKTEHPLKSDLIETGLTTDILELQKTVWTR